MKAKLVGRADFEPVTIQITIETKAELDALGALTNYSPCNDVVEGLGGSDILTPIREQLERAGAEIDATARFGELLLETPAIRHAIKNRINPK